MPEKVRLPNETQRLAVIGRTGSGKTVAALWHLSRRNLQARPWIVYDYKTDEHINAIERAQHVDTDFVPKGRDKGVFIVHPLPEQDDEAVANQMWALWRRGNVGVYIDEGYMIDSKNKAFKALLTQGRSKRIPMIVLSQRPVWLSRFVFSEADFIQCFDLTDERDWSTVESFMPVEFDRNLKEYHSRYYDVGKRRLNTFAPVPYVEKILERIDDSMRPERVWI